MPTVLFHRDFQGFTGGHLKVWNYFEHVEATEGFQARIYFSPESRWDASNPWMGKRFKVEQDWRPQEADVLFAGGYDWNAIPAMDAGPPIINLIQHVHHGDPAHPLSGFLGRRAIRLCVSAEVQAAIEARGVNGPTFVIPNGIDALPEPAPREERPVDWLICGLKEDRPAMARALAKAAANLGRVEALTKLLPRAEFLAALAGAKNVALLPRATEGFYLPALEAMALGALVVCPDCVGNRSFCRDGDTSLTRGLAEVPADIERAHAMPLAGQRAMIARARAVAARHTLAAERAAFQQVLAALPALW